MVKKSGQLKDSQIAKLVELQKPRLPQYEIKVTEL